ncbi:MAB_1171c family putative transporter [Streptomyces noursei]|uniref:MAB_1171c family putative transporter n=1 Tax=Streptomyces noursei TaxID=1971 RepID=UPI0038137322
MLLHNTIYGILAVITWSAFFYKAKDLVKDWRNPELLLLCLAIATFATPFVFAAPWMYVLTDALLGKHNIATLIIYVSVAICLTSFVALLVSWSSAQSKIRLRHRLLVAYSVTTIIFMVVFFLLGDVDDAEHPIDFDVHYARAPHISWFLLTYQLLFTVSMTGLIVLCWRYAKAVDANRPWLGRGLRVVTVGAVFGLLGYSMPKIVSLLWDQFGHSQMLDFVNSVLAPMSASVAAALFSVGFTMPAWGVGLDRSREFVAGFRAYRRLYPLWQAIASTFPEVVLFPPTPRQTRWTARNVHLLLRRQVIEIRDGRLALRPQDDPEVEHTAQNLKLLLNRQIIEIRDGQLALRRHYDLKVANAARSLAEAQGIQGDDLEAVIEASQIAVALKARTDGHTPAEQQPALTHDPADGDRGEEGAWLTRVADAYLSSPVVHAVLATTRTDKDPEVA